MSFPSSMHPAGLSAMELAYFANLNPEQRAAAEHTEGPLLVLAGAGTGKTRVLTTRLSHILSSRRAYPNQVLCVTFTNKAAKEMRSRIGELIGSAVEGMSWLGTFHSISIRILRNHPELAGLKPGFSILDRDDQIRLLKQILQSHHIDEKRWPARHLSALIDGWKNRGIFPDKVSLGEEKSFANGFGAARLYTEYQLRLKSVNAVDFGDLLLDSLNILQKNQDILHNYHKKIKYIMVDEYQDTNVTQYLWLRLLAQGTGNICCVGDDDQSIYGWRGAEIDNILRFEKDFPGAKIIRLEQNYRSSPQILGAASGLIAKNESRLGKTLHSTREDGDPLILRAHWDGDEEARAIGDDIENIQRQKTRLNDIAILVRASFQMRAFEDRFISLGLPYRVVGGPRFYERAEIRDALAYFKLIIAPQNDLAFERIINIPKRGIGATALTRLRDHARQHGLSLYDAAVAFLNTHDLTARTRTALGGLLGQFARWRDLVSALPHTELATRILDESGYSEMWRVNRNPDALGRLENLKELIRSMAEFENMAAFLEHIALVMDVGNDDLEDKVNIMTLHAAKGLEFSAVFLPGWEEGLFPHQRSLDEKGLAGLEEERRLAYVGITRAKHKATISFAQNRRVHNLWQSAQISRFVSELPLEHVKLIENSYSHSSSSYGATRPGQQNQQKTIGISNTSDSFDKGERIFHEKFGAGNVTFVDGNRLTICFDKAGEKRILDSFVKRL